MEFGCFRLLPSVFRPGNGNPAGRTPALRKPDVHTPGIVLPWQIIPLRRACTFSEHMTARKVAREWVFGLTYRVIRKYKVGDSQQHIHSIHTFYREVT
jgi:hypothetical protein